MPTNHAKAILATSRKRVQQRWLRKKIIVATIKAKAVLRMPHDTPASNPARVNRTHDLLRLSARARRHASEAVATAKYDMSLKPLVLMRRNAGVQTAAN